MIVTVTPNPSLDRTLQVERLVVARVNRALETRTDAGGKGVNVARALARQGIAVRAIVPMGGASGRELGERLTDQGIRVVPVPLNGPTRTNIAVVDHDGVVTKVNEAGSPMGAAALAELSARVQSNVGDGDWVAACGSLPPGAPDDLYAALVRVAHEAGARIAVDSSGAPLAAAIEAGPDLIKPNRHELEELTGRSRPDLPAVVAACRDLVDRGVGSVLASLGAEGAVLVDGRGQWHATATAREVRSDVGAGDASLAGFLAAGAAGPDALRQAVAWGTAAVAQPGTAMPGPDDVHLDAVTLVVLPVPDPTDPTQQPTSHTTAKEPR